MSHAAPSTPAAGTPAPLTSATSSSGWITARRAASRAMPVVAPLVVGAAALQFWEWSIGHWDIKPFVLPAPSAIGDAFSNAGSAIWDSSVFTGQNALLGLLIGAVLGVIGAVVSSAAKPFEMMAAPMVLVASVIPIVSLAPIFYTWFGSGENTGRVLVAAIAAGIPVYLNTLRGLTTVATVHTELMQVYNASPWQRAAAVTLPTALPYVFTGLRIASSLAVISALIAEYFGGPSGGLGKAITNSVASSNYPMAWAFVAGAVGLGLVFYVVALLVELWFSRHQPSS